MMEEYLNNRLWDNRGSTVLIKLPIHQVNVSKRQTYSGKLTYPVHTLDDVIDEMLFGVNYKTYNKNKWWVIKIDRYFVGCQDLDHDIAIK